MTYALAWKTWFPLIERAAAPLSLRMIALACVSEGHSVLDIGTGIGEPALTAAAAVGARGSVLAIDPDREMIAIARERAAIASAENVRFLVQRVEELRLAPESVDAVLCRWSLMFVDDLAETLARLRPLLRPGGRLVAATWGRPERVPALSLARRVIHRHFGREPPAYGWKTAFALADGEALAKAFRSAGFTEIVQEQILLAYEFRSAEEYIRFRSDCTGPLFSGVGPVSDAERESALEAVAAALQPFRTPEGPFRLANDAFCTLGKAEGG